MYLPKIPSLEIAEVYKPSVANHECVTLRALSTVNLAQYALVLAYRGTVISPFQNFFFWLGDIEVSANTYIFVFTGKGQTKYDKLQNGDPCLILYWGLERTVFVSNEHVPVLIQIGAIAEPKALNFPALLNK